MPLSKKILQGFTIIELLVVMGIIAILFTITIVSVNPSRQFAKARDTRRESDVFAILGAIFQYQAEHGGDLPETSTQTFPTSATCIGTAVGCFDLGGAGDTGEEMVPVYMAEIPVDPKPVDSGCLGDQTNTCYEIWVDANKRLHGAATGETKTIEAVK